MESSFEKFAKERTEELLGILAERNRQEINEFMSNVQEAWEKKSEKVDWNLELEKKVGLDRLMKAIQGYEINDKSVLVKEERCKPEFGETYWSPGPVGPVDWKWAGDNVDLARYDCGMVLRTKKEAVDVMEQIKHLLTRKP